MESESPQLAVATAESTTALRLCVLASGSSGNCTVVFNEAAAVMIDAGLSARETARRLDAVGLSLDRISGILISHEHGDHIAGLRVLHQKHGIPCYANHGTAEAIARNQTLTGVAINLFSTGFAFEVGGFSIEPFSVPHDAYEPVGFVISTPASRVGVVTDMGVATGVIRSRLAECEVIVVEANHDEGMLMDAERPWALKQRIRGRQGHLSNQAAAQLIGDVAGPHLKRVYLAHLSEDCNRAHLAEREVRTLLDKRGWSHVEVAMTYPDRISDVWG